MGVTDLIDLAKETLKDHIRHLNLIFDRLDWIESMDTFTQQSRTKEVILLGNEIKNYLHELHDIWGYLTMIEQDFNALNSPDSLSKTNDS